MDNTFRVALVCMPFYSAARPSIQIGLLHAIAERAGFPVDPHHLNLELSARLTPKVYETLCSHRGRMTGEWLFSVAAFGEDACRDHQEFIRDFPDEIDQIKQCGKDGDYLVQLRREILPAFVEECLDSTDWGSYRVVGFTSSFQQNVASLALARRIKERHPSVTILFGGANMEDEMGPEYVRAFPFIDYAVVGEADLSFPALLRHLASNAKTEEPPGVVRRTDDGVAYAGQAPSVREMDDLPTPIYDEYFERVARLNLLTDPQYAWGLPFESSRGCWWGQKHHCTFCGLNGLDMAFRAKTPERLLVELDELSSKYGLNYFEATDNILDMKYVNGFFKTVRETKPNYRFFYEVKANLTPEQVRMLYEGGVRYIQPGIESLSTHVLKLMRKGATMLHNVRLMKWCRYYGIRNSYNLIWGFPGETEQDYRDELELVKLLTHLEPPIGCSRIWLERFSPYFVDRKTFPVRDVRAETSYAHVYPAHVSLDKAAYFFDYTMDDTLPDEAHRELSAWLKVWRQRWNSDEPDSLIYRPTEQGLRIDDNRGPERRGSHTFDGPRARIYEFCNETMHGVPRIAKQLALPEPEVQAALDEFCRLGLMVGEDGKYLSLALPDRTTIG